MHTPSGVECAEISLGLKTGQVQAESTLESDLNTFFMIWTQLGRNHKHSSGPEFDKKLYDPDPN